MSEDLFLVIGPLKFH